MTVAMRVGASPPATGGAGRKPGTTTCAAAIAKSLMADDVENVVRALLDAARDGDTTAARLVLERLYPAPRSTPVVADDDDGFELPAINTAADAKAAQLEIVTACTDGRLTIDEADRLTAMVERIRAAAITEDIEQRLDAIEQETAA